MHSCCCAISGITFLYFRLFSKLTIKDENMKSFMDEHGYTVCSLIIGKVEEYFCFFQGFFLFK